MAAQVAPIGLDVTMMGVMNRARFRRFLVVTGVFVVLALSPSSRISLEEIHRWQLDEVNGNVVTIGVDVGSGNCDHFNRIDVSETDTEVQITAIVNHGPVFRNALCRADDVWTLVDVTFDAPLGDRTSMGCRPPSEKVADSAEGSAASCGP